MAAVNEHKPSFSGGMLRAAARQAGWPATVSGDMQHGRRLGGVGIVDPFPPHAAATMATLLDV